jgi:hypothetical protein
MLKNKIKKKYLVGTFQAGFPSQVKIMSMSEIKFIPVYSVFLN